MIMKCSRKRREHHGCVKKVFSVMFLLGMLSYFSCADARPSFSSTSSESMISKEGAAVQQSEQSSIHFQPKTESFLAEKLLKSTNPSANSPQLNKRSLTYEPHEDVQPLKRYPVAQIDFDHVKTPFIIAVWILSAGIARIIFHMFPRLRKIIPESCLLIAVGIIIGCIFYFSTNSVMSPLTPNIFFLYMLPPIIFDAGYFMPNRKFFDNLGTILLMAVVGTIFNIVTIGSSLWLCGLTGIYGDESMTPKFLDTFLFASLISAVDPVAVLAVFEQIHVNEVLYIVVFGESLLNDAVTVVMYHMMESYNEIGVSNILPVDIVSAVASFFVVALGGTIIGIIWGALTGFVTRFTEHVRVIEPLFVFVMAYLSYLSAEAFHMSGILAITFCGITMKNYVESNVSHKSRTTIKYALKMLSNSSETIIFIFLGVATVHNQHVWNTWFVVLTILFCIIFRTFGVILLTAIINRFRLHKLSGVEQFVMSYGGLRGAVAFALVLLIDGEVVPQKDMFVTTTMAVIYFTVFIQGVTIGPLVKYLDVKRSDNRKITMNERINKRFTDHVLAGVECIVGDMGKYQWRDSFRRFNDRYIKPFLIKDVEQSERKIIETYSKLTLRDAMFMVHNNSSFTSRMVDNDSSLFRNQSSFSLKERNESRLWNFDDTNTENSSLRNVPVDPEIHRMLCEQLRPYRQQRKMDSIKGKISNRRPNIPIYNNSKINFRRMIKERTYRKYNQGSQQDISAIIKRKTVSFHKKNNGEITFNDVTQQQQNAKVENNEDEDVGLTFTVKPKEQPLGDNPRKVQRYDSEKHLSHTEAELPWKRNLGATSVIKQIEFPMWISAQDSKKHNGVVEPEFMDQSVTNDSIADKRTDQLSMEKNLANANIRPGINIPLEYKASPGGRSSINALRNDKNCSLQELNRAEWEPLLPFSKSEQNLKVREIAESSSFKSFSSKHSDDDESFEDYKDFENMTPKKVSKFL